MKRHDTITMHEAILTAKRTRPSLTVRKIAAIFGVGKSQWVACSRRACPAAARSSAGGNTRVSSPQGLSKLLSGALQHHSGTIAELPDPLGRCRVSALSAGWINLRERQNRHICWTNQF